MIFTFLASGNLIYLHIWTILDMLQLKGGFAGERAIVLPPMIVRMMEADRLLSALHITDIGYYPNAEYHYLSRSNPIDQHVFIYCTRGSGEYTVEGETYRVKENQFFILPAGVPHSYCSDSLEPWTIYWIHFKGKLSIEYLPQSHAPLTINPETGSRINDRIVLFEEMFNTLKNGYNLDNLRYSSSLLHHFLGTLKFLNQYREANINKINESNVVDAAIHLMQENVEKQMTLSMLTEYTGYSSSHFSFLFKHKTGHAPLAYFNLLKIQQACFMLDDTDMKINQISSKLGINDPYYFSRLFTKIMGISPVKYRQRKKG